ncbi:MAG: hypothetical protein M3Q68_04875 [Actinomycetota bacterium]|nr:hypothetical protein [Actinomycetota bacterium]
MASLDAVHVRSVSRRLWDVIEPLASSVYFVPEVHANYEKLGLPGFGAGYFCSRAACMGEVPGEVVAATFAVFNPAIVVPAVEEGWSKTDAPTILAARLDGQRAALGRLLGDAAEDTGKLARATELLVRAADAAPLAGRPLFAGLRSLGLPGDPLGDLWRAADVVREHRGDSHVLAWTAMHLTPVEITLLTELWWHQSVGGYIRTRGWSAEEIEAGIASLRERGFIDGDPATFTPAGEQLRTVVEEMTDGGEAELVAALGDDAEELLDLLAPLTDAILAAKGYPRDPAAIGRT